MSDTQKRDWKKHYVPTPRPGAVAGVTIGGAAHKTLLAMRATGRVEVNQLIERLGDSARAHLPNLARLGYIKQSAGDSGAWHLTPSGRALVAPDGPLAARRTLQTYCQL